MQDNEFVPTCGKNELDTQRLSSILAKFEQIYKVPPTCIVRAPGRVNLIGEHVDYSGFPVCPMAIDKDVLIAVTPSRGNKCEIANTNDKYKSESFEISISPEEITSSHTWVSYVKAGWRGVVETLELGTTPVPFLAVVDGIVPPGSGLSSSSALVCASALATMVVNNLKLTKKKMAQICQDCERYVGTMGGGMDQAICFLGNKGTASLIHFNPISVEIVPLPEGHVFIVANSLRESNKCESAPKYFNKRVVECKLAAKILAKTLLPNSDQKIERLYQVQSLLGCSLEEMKKKVDSILHKHPYSRDEIASILQISSENLTPASLQSANEFELWKRAYHVYHESSLVQQFKLAKSAVELGNLMNESHKSCQELFECSCEELDTLVAICRRAGALGSRLTGAGWGGCTVSLVPAATVSSFMERVQAEYYASISHLIPEGNISNSLFQTSPGQGAFIVQL